MRRQTQIPARLRPARVRPWELRAAHWYEIPISGWSRRPARSCGRCKTTPSRTTWPGRPPAASLTACRSEGGAHRRNAMNLNSRWHRRARSSRVLWLLAFMSLVCGALPASAQTLNVYSIWPENWAKPMFEEFERATAIKANFVRFSSGGGLPRVIAEKKTPRVDVLFGGPVETFAAGVTEGVFESYKPPSFAKLAPRFKQADGQWV